MFKISGKLFGKRSVVVVDPEQVIRDKIIGYINIFPAITVDVCNVYRMPVPSVCIPASFETSV